MSKKIGLSKCVEGFLGLVMNPPEKMPRQQYRQHEIYAEIRGFNKAQEHLRGVLKLNGTPTAVRLAEVRADGQQHPQKIGNKNLWFC